MWLDEYIVEESRDLIKVNNREHDFTFEMWGWCPVQAVGEAAGREFYFRARHEEWSCEVSNAEGGLTSDGFQGGFYREGRYKNAGWMPLRDALEIIGKCMGEYFASGAPIE